MAEGTTGRRVRAIGGIAGAVVVAWGAPLRAQITVLTFEGPKDAEAVQNFYNGGTGSLGSRGPNYGIAFSSNALAVVRNNVGGSGNFGDEPSPVTIMSFLTGSAATLDVAAGFATGFSFYYSTPFNPGSIRVYDGLNATGNVLATLTLPTTPDGATAGCTDNPGAAYCPLLPIGVSFAGVARSIDFGGTGNNIGFDNITFGSATPMPGVPEPSTVALVAAGLTGLAGVVRARRRAAA